MKEMGTRAQVLTQEQKDNDTDLKSVGLRKYDVEQLRYPCTQRNLLLSFFFFFLQIPTSAQIWQCVTPMDIVRTLRAVTSANATVDLKGMAKHAQVLKTALSCVTIMTHQHTR